MKKLIIKTQSNGKMFINGADVGTGSQTQFGMTGDPLYVTAVFKKQTGDKLGNTIAIYHVYNNFDKNDIAEMQNLNIKRAV